MSFVLTFLLPNQALEFEHPTTTVVVRGLVADTQT